LVDSVRGIKPAPSVDAAVLWALREERRFNTKQQRCSATDTAQRSAHKRDRPSGSKPRAEMGDPRNPSSWNSIRSSFRGSESHVLPSARDPATRTRTSKIRRRPA
ncbi:unnamed protein product, partial [Scytosiphon promiscuus]